MWITAYEFRTNSSWPSRRPVPHWPLFWPKWPVCHSFCVSVLWLIARMTIHISVQLYCEIVHCQQTPNQLPQTASFLGGILKYIYSRFSYLNLVSMILHRPILLIRIHCTKNLVLFIPFEKFYHKIWLKIFLKVTVTVLGITESYSSGYNWRLQLQLQSRV